jgi:uncharacterized cupin superfamily protein
MTRALKLPALDPMSVTPRRGSSYPAPFREPVEGRVKQVLGDPLGLTDFGVNLVRLEPGAWSSQRHWHSHEDEFLLVLEGDLALVTDEGETALSPGRRTKRAIPISISWPRAGRMAAFSPTRRASPTE